MSEFKEAIEVLKNLGAKKARALKFNNTQGRQWVRYVDGVKCYINNGGQLVVIRYANSDGYNGERKLSVKGYAEAISAAGFKCEIKNNVLYVNSKIGE